MEIRYFDVFSKGWDRMKKSLFSKPFNLDKWFAVGFTAFLANLVSGSSGGGSNSFMKKYNGGINIDKIFTFPKVAIDWLNVHPYWFTIIILGLLLFFAIIITLLWLSSRGHFMFLHNVVYDKDEVKMPWKEYQKEGDSLFVWRLVYGVIIFFIMVFVGIYSFIFVKNLYFGEFTFSDKIVTLLSFSLVIFIFFIITSYISLFLKDFIAPIMLKHRMTATEAWSFFLPLLRDNIFHFLLYGIFILFLWLVTVAAIVAFGFASCCIGFLFLIIPYIGTVLLLPVYYTFRALSVEFLEQFGDEFTLFPKEETNEEGDIILV